MNFAEIAFARRSYPAAKCPYTEVAGYMRRGENKKPHRAKAPSVFMAPYLPVTRLNKFVGFES